MFALNFFYKTYHPKELTLSRSVSIAGISISQQQEGNVETLRLKFLKSQTNLTHTYILLLLLLRLSSHCVRNKLSGR